MSERDAISWLLIVLAAGDLIVTAILVAAAAREHNIALSERAASAVILTFAATSVAVLGALNLARVVLPPGWTLVILTVGLVAVSLPQFLWLGTWLAGKFK